jgi:hypothetical protein
MNSGQQWMWAEEYSDKRSAAAILLDVMGYCRSLEIRRTLLQTVQLRDPRLKHFAVISLLRHGQKIPTSQIDAVASSDEMRVWLYDQLEEQGKLHLFPPRFANQKSLAQSDMVQWLTFPSELGRVPDEIQLMKVVPAKSNAGKIVDYYVFRFRMKTDPDGWLAGIAGPYPHDKSLVVSGEHTFSQFEKWDSRTPEGHVKSRLGMED